MAQELRSRWGMRTNVALDALAQARLSVILLCLVPAVTSAQTLAEASEKAKANRAAAVAAGRMVLSPAVMVPLVTPESSNDEFVRKEREERARAYAAMFAQQATEEARDARRSTARMQLEAIGQRLNKAIIGPGIVFDGDEYRTRKDVIKDLQADYDFWKDIEKKNGDTP